VSAECTGRAAVVRQGEEMEIIGMVAGLKDQKDLDALVTPLRLAGLPE
jgi:hypothetical protein